MKMTVRGRIELLEYKVSQLESEKMFLSSKLRRMQSNYDRLLERLTQLEKRIPQHSCECIVQPSKNASAPKEITVKIPYDIICD